MKNDIGSNNQNVKLQNRLLVLKHIATQPGISRIDIARITDLSKMTASNIVNDLLSANLIEEFDASPTPNSFGRRPIMLTLASQSPCICGMLVKRKLCQVVLSDLGGNIIFHDSHPYSTLRSPEDLLDILKQLFYKCKQNTTRRIAAIGIACVGPLDSTRGYILKPPYFHGIENFPIVSRVQEITGLPTYLVNDATAGAFSEKMFGLGASIENFAYLHIMNGIGAGFVLNHALYDGDSGQSGEIGHTSINFNGPVCACGNRGCLDLYARTDAMQTRIRELSAFYPGSPLTNSVAPDWNEIVSAGNRRDPLAIVVLEEFCSYIAYSLTNAINLLNLSTVIVGYSSEDDGNIIEELIGHKLNNLVMSAKYQPISVIHSSFRGDAPLIGSAALIADKIFNHSLPLKELEMLTN